MEHFPASLRGEYRATVWGRGEYHLHRGAAVIGIFSDRAEAEAIAKVLNEAQR
jgi:alpha-D-ribose 1-methylphosphonate 5-triphosphate synthase subunit PhnL